MDEKVSELNQVEFIIKRDGRVVPYDRKKQLRQGQSPPRLRAADRVMCS